MRTRVSVLAAIVCGLTTLSVALPGVAGAAPRHNDGLTIAATPNPIPSGEGVLIYGQLKGSDVANQTIDLYHRLALQPNYTLVSTTKTNQYGFYEFTRAEGVVLTNRNWFAIGPNGTHSRTVHERVYSAVTLTAGTAGAQTRQPVTFTGTVSPSHNGQRVLLQEQTAVSGNGWHTIASGYTAGGYADQSSSFTIQHAFKIAGDYTLRAYFPTDPRNLAGASDPVTVSIQQAQNPTFTIATSNPLTADGQPVTIFGTLDQKGTTTPDAGTAVTLYGRTANGSFAALANTVTGADGSYTFTQTPANNTIYRARTSKPYQATAPLYEGVQETVTMTPSTTSTQEGSVVTFSGTVAPDHSGHELFLQRQGPGGHWINVASGYLTTGSKYSLPYQFGQTGSFAVRTRIYGGPENVGGASAPATITVSGAAAASTLPPAS
jgi:hypothetical protein